MSNPSVCPDPVAEWNHAWAFGPDRDQLINALCNAAIDAHQEAQCLLTRFFNGSLSFRDFETVVFELRDYVLACDDRVDSLIPF